MSDNDTYQYQEDDAVKSKNYEEYIDDSDSTGQSIINNPKFIGFASLILGVYILGYIISMFTSGSNTSTNTKQNNPPVQAQAVDTHNQKFSTMDANFNKQQALIQQLTNSNQQLNIAVNDLRKSLASLKSKQQMMSSNQSTVVESDIDTLHNELADMRDRISNNENKLKAMEPTKPKKPLAHFYLRGIIDGRAWISNEKGDNKTIRVGDSLPDYGRISGIFPDSGFVMTTSKRMISFSQGDS